MNRSDPVVAGIAMSCELYDKNANVEKACKLIDRAVKNNANIVLLQELFNTGYIIYHVRNDKTFDLAEPIPGPTTDRLAKKAKEHGIYVISPIYEKAGPGLYYNSAPVISPSGEIIGIQRKIHVPLTTSLERYYFRPGHEYVVFNTEYGNLGIVICYDRHFPENWRNVALRGAEIVLVPAAAYYPNWDMELRVMSYQNNVFTVAVNRIGEETLGEKTIKLAGASLIADPMGNILAQLNDGEEGVVLSPIKLEEVDKARRKTAFFHMMRPEMYKRLSDPLVS
jgi:predicted amidohydrolase